MNEPKKYSKPTSYLKKLKYFKYTLISLIFIISMSFMILPIVNINIKKQYFTLAKTFLDSMLKKDITPPVISGTTKNGGAYYLSAQKVTNNLFSLGQKKTTITITEPSLLYTTNKNNTVIKISAASAKFDSDNYRVTIEGTAEISSNKSYSGEFKNTTIDIKQEKLVTSGSLSLNFDDKNIYANGLNIDNSKGLIVFKGPVSIKTISEKK